jgi:hypothetical protein
MAGCKGYCDDRGMPRRAIALSVLAIPAFALIVAGVTQARERPELALAGGGAVATGLQLAAGLLLTFGAVECARRGEAAAAVALVAACRALGLHALPTPAHGVLLFTLVAAAVGPAAGAHAALLHPGGRPAGALDRFGAASGYAIHAGLGRLLIALVFDPQRGGCFARPSNLLPPTTSPACRPIGAAPSSSRSIAQRTACAALRNATTPFLSRVPPWLATRSAGAGRSPCARTV